MLIMDYDDAIKKAVEMAEGGHIHEALEILIQILEKYPNDYNALMYQAEYFINYGWFMQSLSNLIKVWKKKPQEPHTYAMAGKLFRILGLNHYAKDFYYEAIKNNHPESEGILEFVKSLEETEFVPQKFYKFAPSDDGTPGFREFDFGENLKYEMKLKIKEVKSNIAIVRLEFKKLIKEMNIQNNATLI